MAPLHAARASLASRGALAGRSRRVAPRARSALSVVASTEWVLDSPKCFAYRQVDTTPCKPGDADCRDGRIDKHSSAHMLSLASKRVPECESKTPINISALCAELQKRSVVVGDRETAAAARTSLDFDVSPFTSERCLVRFGVDDLGREDSVTVTQLAPRGAATVDGASLEPGRAFPLTAGSLVDLSGLGNELSFVLLRDSLAHA